MLKRIACIGAMVVSFVVVAAGAGDGPSPADSTNLLPGIVDSHSWVIWNPSGTASDACTATPEDGAMRVDIPKKEPAGRGERGFGCSRVSVKAGIAYTLRFTAKASEPRQITMSSLEMNKPGESIIGQAAIEIKPSWQTYVCRIVPVRDSTEKTWLPYFQFGDNVGTVWFRNVTLTGDGTPSAAASIPPGARNVAPPAPKDSDAADAWDNITPVSSIPDMTNESAWKFIPRGGRGSAHKEGDTLQINATKLGEVEPALVFPHLEFLVGKSYRLKFSAKSDPPVQIKVVAQSNVMRHAQDFSTPVAISLTKEWQDYDIKLTLAKPAGADLFMLSFLFVDKSSNILFRNMSLIPE